MEEPPPVYVVDDDQGMRGWLCDALAEDGLACRCFCSGDAFLAQADQLPPGCLLLDMRMPGRNGLQVQAELIRRGISMVVVVITGSSTVETVVEAMKLGAIDVLEKPFLLDSLLDTVQRAIARLPKNPA